MVILTDQGDKEIAVKALKLGAFDYVTKNQGYLFKLPSVIENAHYSMEALDLFRKMPAFFDLLITDLTMPTMTGDQLATEIMAIRQDLPVILCTGYSRKISEETASEIGIRALAYKPILKADLAKTVRQVLDES